METKRKCSLKRQVINMKNIKSYRNKAPKAGASVGNRARKAKLTIRRSNAIETFACHEKTGVQLRGGACEKYRNLSSNLYWRMVAAKLYTHTQR